MKIETLQKISLVFGVLLCLLPGFIVGTKIVEIGIYLLEKLVSIYSLSAVILTGTLVIGIVFIFFGIYESPNTELTEEK